MRKLLTILLLTFSTTVFAQVAEKKDLVDFLPEGYDIFEKIDGDLNKDGLEDNVLVIKGTDISKVKTDEDRGELDRNRRGIIVLFNTNGNYELALENYECLNSENEDGGVYFPPELSVKIEKENLYFHFGHGRYGSWEYTFRFQNSEFELIGYDETSKRGPVTDRKTSINFLTRKKHEKVNTYENELDEVFKETWTTIEVKRLIKLSEIKDFDELDMTVD
ncbi:hypothetical protein [Algoriphagus antarcticus]|uniref:VCBS repeat protein n=1 Tax=Algoriphagus antarcticus TaxID=238540 RepID=A0A3E0DPJ3_9BACT|nr:hypothetical protein [Algoriphagus antarcticus]REG83384.1 hypothetical protein C8N25_11829 [Algoriphagus antarcticus]